MSVLALLLLQIPPVIRPDAGTGIADLPVYCAAKGTDGSKRDFFLTFHISKSNTWKVDIVPAKGSITPSQPFLFDEVSHQSRPSKENGASYIAAFQFKEAAGGIYGLTSILKLEGDAITEVRASLYSDKENSVSKLVVCEAVTGNEST
jgi:hypothetical protein